MWHYQCNSHKGRKPRGCSLATHGRCETEGPGPHQRRPGPRPSGYKAIPAGLQAPRRRLQHNGNPSALSRRRRTARRQWPPRTGRKPNHPHLISSKRAGATTTEVTVLSVQEVQPAGAWVTINWDQFGYRQPAWIEGAGGTYWPGSVLLITPDPNQVHIGQPWPPTYRIAESDCRAVAPAPGH